MPRDLEGLADIVILTVGKALTPLLERLATLEAKLTALQASEVAVTELRERVVIAETKAAVMTPAPVAAAPTVDIGPLTASLAELSKDLGAVRERLIAVEVRQPVPGPQGPAGKDGLDGKDGKDGLDGKDGRDGLSGKDGLNGKDGADGLGFDDLIVEHDGERRFTFKAVKGDRVKALGPFVVPAQIGRGVFVEGSTYERGDVVTWGGSQWLATESTTVKPAEGSKAWTLVVKRGRDGRDGKDAGTLPVVSVGRA